MSRLGFLARRAMRKKLFVWSNFQFCHYDVVFYSLTVVLPSCFFPPPCAQINDLVIKTHAWARFKLSGTYLLTSLIRSSLFEWAQAPCDLCWLLVTALSKSSLFMFNQEDQLPARSIITLQKAHSPICSWEAQWAEPLIDRVRPFQLTVAAHRPHCCQVTGDFVPAYSLDVVRLASVITWWEVAANKPFWNVRQNGWHTFTNMPNLAQVGTSTVLP